MDDQMRVLIQDRNRMEEKLKQELHSVKLQLNHSIKSAHNPFYLKKAKVAQPSLYDGNELINVDHDPIDVPSSEEDLELAEPSKTKAKELERQAPPLLSCHHATVYPLQYTSPCCPSNAPTTNTVVTDSALSASRFHDLSTAYNVAMNRVVELESENSRLLRKIKHDDHDTMIKAFSKLEVAHVNLQLKQQHLKENVNNLKSKSSRDVPEFDVF
ncbi:hypothetical protein Tco_0871045 [Tanacetum coccineum]